MLLTSGEADAAAATLASAVTQWAAAEEVSLTVTVASPARAVDAIVEAIDLGPDLIVSTGAELVDPLAVVSASHLDHQFLIVGAQLPNPRGT